MKEIIEHESWWKRNWKWFTPVFGVFLIVIGLISTSEFGANVSDVASDVVKAYADPDLIDRALLKAQENDEVVQLLGTLKPIDKMAIFEGAVKYSNNDTSIDISVRVKGSKGIGRMRIFADRNVDKWEYKEIVIGIKKLNKTIIIIERKE